MLRFAPLLYVVALLTQVTASQDPLGLNTGPLQPQQIVSPFPPPGSALKINKFPPSEWKDGGKPTPDASGDPDYTPPQPHPSLDLSKLPDARPPLHKRRFRSNIVDAEISRVADRIVDPALRRIWSNTFPNTLDTTVGWVDLDLMQTDHSKAFPRSFLITGDIEASWLRDSTSQIFPYLDLLSNPGSNFTVGDTDWVKLYRLVLGLVYQQSQFVITSPTANSFGSPKSANIRHPKNGAINDNRDSVADWFAPPPPKLHGHYQPFPGKRQRSVAGNDGVYLWEAKWEVDSLANFLRLPVALNAATGRSDFVNNPTWQRAVRLAIDTLRSQQRGSDEEHQAMEANTIAYPQGILSRTGEWVQRFGSVGGGVYRFQRLTRTPTETRGESGLGEPAKRTGLVKSAFRPSDDGTVFPFLVPSNALLAVSLEGISALLVGVQNMTDVADNAKDFAGDIRSAITEWAIQPRKAVSGVFDSGDVYAFEVDGYGSNYFMDDANVPSLLSLPYLGFVDASDPTYQRTRSLCLSSKTNKWFFNGTVAAGVGGPHVGYPYAWPMSRIMQILTSNDTQEYIDALRFLRSSTAGTGLMHESINVNDASDFTRPWFAWVNGLFGEAVRKLDKEGSVALTMTY